jgi:acetyltransferase-like isoleucine patch superfamily enzyme
MAHLTVPELLALGFESVGEGCQVSPLASFHGVSGKLGNRVRIDDFAILTGRIVIDDNVHVSPFCFLNGTGGGIHCEEDSGMGAGCKLLTRSDDYSDVSTGGTRSKLEGQITLGRRTILGVDVLVLPGVFIGQNSTIGTKCTIVSSVPDQSRLMSSSVRTVGFSSSIVMESVTSCQKCQGWLNSQVKAVPNTSEAEQSFDSLAFIELLEAVSDVDERVGLELARFSFKARTTDEIVHALHTCGLCSSNLID